MNPVISKEIKIQIPVGNKTVEIEKKEIPIISRSTLILFQALNAPLTHQLSFPLKDKILTLNATCQKLKEAKDNSFKDKLVGVLKAALYVSVIAVGILLSIIFPKFAFAFGSLTLLTCLGIADYYASSIGFSADKWSSMLKAFALVLAPGLPIYEEFGKIYRIEEQICLQKKEIAQHLMQMKEFFEKDLTDLRRGLNEEIGKIEESLKALNSFLIPAPKAVEIALVCKKSSETALEELNKGAVFFQSIK